MRWKAGIGALLFVLYCSQVFSDTNKLNVTVNQTTFIYEEPVRLSDVLAPIALEQPWYWPASKLFVLETDKAELQRQQIMKQIAKLSTQVDGPVQTTLQRLRAELLSWQLGERIPYLIDYDLARADLKFNPRFTHGTFQLFLTERPVSVTFFGALNGVVTLPHRGATQLRDYLKDVVLPVGASSEFVTIIEPTGDVRVVGAQIWNKSFVEVMPGSMIYIHFSESLFQPGFAELNKLVPVLVAHRMY